MAGHIDHGKTSLTKALTNWDTDRLKEEKERQISIELGFAPLYDDNQMNVSVVDVPGHERFIRQMIAGVAGIDLVILVVSAEEGVMPQTKEHLEILEFLGIKKGIVAITKVDRVDEMLLMLAEGDIIEELKGTIFEGAPVMLVDSISGHGIETLRTEILSTLSRMENRYVEGGFRMPIDQVFTVKGVGTVVRGTAYDGNISEGDALTILPSQLPTRARQLQLFGKPTGNAYAGQRVAINLAGLDKSDLKRGDVVVNSTQFMTTDVIDVVFKTVRHLDSPIKQRMPIKCHIGTTEVMGKIVMFDRKEMNEENEEILCQIRLDHSVVTKRGDRFILRRPSPQETIGGGWVIDPKGSKYRFGEATITLLEDKKTGTDNERVLQLLSQYRILSDKDIMKYASIDEDALNDVLDSEIGIVTISDSTFTNKRVFDHARSDVENLLRDYHDKNTMRLGMNKAELLQKLSESYPKPLLEFVLYKSEHFVTKEQFVALTTFTPHVPKSWERKVSQVLFHLESDRWSVKYLDNYLDEEGIPKQFKADVTRYLVETRRIVPLDQQFFVSMIVFEKSVNTLKKMHTIQFDTSQAKDALGISRKYLIPFLEKLDEFGFTKRMENTRKWIEK
ncbi:MAG: translation elongation factor [Bacillales bacterium]|jgi:selenocysteine-specific elongation factor|nr:translation elongation factor [Bacillales bacterium]